MQHERIWPASQPAGSENAGDVLASIRRLIAQDQSRLSPVPGGAPRSALPRSLPPEARFDPPFVLDRKDMIPGGRNAPASALDMSQRHPTTGSAPSPRPLAAPAVASMSEAPTGWRSAALADWPKKPAVEAAPVPPAAVPLPQETALSDAGDQLSPEEEAEFAEAEAALARMIGPRSDAANQAPQPQAASEDAMTTEETPMAQDMRKMEMGRIDDFTAIPRQDAMASFDDMHGQVNAPNLFGEIGAVAKDATMRMLIRDAIQQELHGELGARLSRNMCQMIRQEVEAVIREICAEQ